jgi:hypothetical protein
MRREDTNQSGKSSPWRLAHIAATRVPLRTVLHAHFQAPHMVFISDNPVLKLLVKAVFHIGVMRHSEVRRVAQVSGYGLDDRGIEVRSSAQAKYFSSSLCVQTGSGVHPASCTMGTGGPFPGTKAGAWRWPLTPIYCRGQEWVGTIPPLPRSAIMAYRGTALLCFWSRELYVHKTITINKERRTSKLLPLVRHLF